MMQQSAQRTGCSPISARWQPSTLRQVSRRRSVVLGVTKPKPAFPEPEVDVTEDDVLPVRKPGAFPRTDVADPTGDEEPAEAPFDPLRDGPLRYLGYANELGEAFAAWVPPFGVPLSYAVAIAYVLTDTYDKGNAAYNSASAELKESGALEPQAQGKLARLLATERSVDTLVWQLLASVGIPGTCIHLVVQATEAVLDGTLHADTPAGIAALAALPAVASAAAATGTDAGVFVELALKTVPTVLGLGAIPFIVEPIDEAVHSLLDNSLRPVFRSYVCGPGGGCEAGLALCNLDTMKEEYPVLNGDGFMGKFISHEQLDGYMTEDE